MKCNSKHIRVARAFVGIALTSLVGLVSCHGTGNNNVAVESEEDAEAKSLLQGVWINDEDNEVMMKVKGDTIFYADSTLTPIRFAIIDDSLVLRGNNVVKYAIEKQTANIFCFMNPSGDVIKLVKSSNPDDNYVFEHRQPLFINQNQLIKRDSVVVSNDKKYHIYTQVNPSTFKVVKTNYSQDGVQGETVYYDNIINVCIYDGGRRLFSRDFRKQDFLKYVPAEFLKQAILSDIVIDAVSDDAVELLADICLPDTYTSYVIRIVVKSNGEMKMLVDKN